MILYFSGTGNCKYAAQKIAAALNDTAVSIEDSGCDISLSDDECFGIVFPTHFWEVSAIVRAFIKRITIMVGRDFYSFAVATYGTTPGCSRNRRKEAV